MNRRDETILDIERTLLATMMLKPGDCFRAQIPPAYYASEQHADIAAAIASRSTDSLPIDPVSIADHFEQAGRAALGHYAVHLGSDALLTAVPEAFAHRIAGAWRQRQSRAIGRMLIESTSEDAVDRALQALIDLDSDERNHEWTAKTATQMAFAELSELHKSAGKLPGVTTGLRELDDKLGGLHRSDLIVVGGRAAMGKTAFLLGRARAAAKAGHPVGIISGEQPVEQMTMRLLSAAGHIDAKKFRTAQFAEEEWPKVYSATADVSQLPMWILDRSAPSLAEVVRVARRWKHVHGIQALYVDYLQRVGGEGERKWEQVGHVARGLKNLARDLDIPVFVLAQVSRAVEGRANQTPRMGDLSDSSEIEKEADQVLMLYRAGYYDADAPQDVARVIVEKNRHGPTGYVDVRWDGATMTFADQDRSYGDAFMDRGIPQPRAYIDD